MSKHLCVCPKGNARISLHCIFFFFSFLKVYFIDCAITIVPFFFSPLFPSVLQPPASPLSPPQVMSMGHTYKFFGFSISYTILNIPLSILCLPIMLLIPCTFLPFSPLPLPTDNPPCDLHFCDSVPVLVACLVCFCFFRFHC